MEDSEIDHKKLFLSSMDQDPAYIEEADFYAVLSLFANGQINEGTSEMDALNKNSWAYLELKKALN